MFITDWLLRINPKLSENINFGKWHKNNKTIYIQTQYLFLFTFPRNLYVSSVVSSYHAIYVLLCSKNIWFSIWYGASCLPLMKRHEKYIYLLVLWLTNIIIKFNIVNYNFRFTELGWRPWKFIIYKQLIHNNVQGSLPVELKYLQGDTKLDAANSRSFSTVKIQLLANLI